MRSLMKWLALAIFAAAVSACGGGGGNPGANPQQPSNPTLEATRRVANFAMFLAPTTLTNSGTQTADLSIIAYDASGTIVANASVTVSTDKASIFTPVRTPSLTGADGSFGGKISPGSDKSDREIGVTVTINGIQRQAQLLVRGSRLTLQATPNNPEPGAPLILSGHLVDAASNGIPNASIVLQSNISTLNGLVRTTGLDGRFTQSFTAPSTPGIYQVEAFGGGVSSGAYQVQVFSTIVPAAVIPAGVVPTLAASPDVIGANGPGTSSSRSTLRFLMVDGQNRPVPNVRVRFFDVTTGVPTVGSSIVDAGKTVYTDASGIVTTQYIAGQNASPTNGVRLRACYSANDFPPTLSSDTCASFVDVTLTVVGQALSVSIGDDNVLQRGDGTTYIKRFVVTVADAAGKPVANAPVDISVDLTHYGKFAGFTFANPFFTAQRLPPGLLSTVSFTVGDTTTTVGTGTAAITITVPGPTFTWCYNEDVNRNGIADPGENIDGSVDTNGQPTLQPRKADLLISYNDPAVRSTNANGVLIIKAEYSQRFATWLAYRVRVTASVQGSQGSNERQFVTNYIEGDDRNGSFNEAPYGRNPSCRVPS